jgi:hypothetical protein
VPLDIEEMNESELEDEPQKFIFKLSDRLGNPLVPDQAQLMNMRNEEPLYMSPHLFESFINGLNQIKLNPYKNDVFALGLIILEAGLLEPIQNLYNYETGEFQYGFLENYKEKFFNKYDDAILRELLDKILEVDEDKRVTPVKLQKTVNSILASLENEEMDEEEENLEKQEEQYEPEQVEPENVEVNPEYYQEQEEYHVQEEQEDSDLHKMEEAQRTEREDPNEDEFVLEEETNMNDQDNLKDQYLQQLEEEYDQGTQEPDHSPEMEHDQERRDHGEVQYQDPPVENVEIEPMNDQHEVIEEDIREPEQYDHQINNQEETNPTWERQANEVEPMDVQDQEFHQNIEAIISPENEQNPETQEPENEDNRVQQSDSRDVFEKSPGPQNLFQEPHQEEDLGIDHFEFQDKKNAHPPKQEVNMVIQEPQLYEDEVIPVQPKDEEQDYELEQKENVFKEDFQGYEQYEEPEEVSPVKQPEEIQKVDVVEPYQQDQTPTTPHVDEKYEDEVYQFKEEENHVPYEAHPNDPVFGNHQNQNYHQQIDPNPARAVKSQIVGIQHNNVNKDYHRNISQPVRTQVIEEPIQHKIQYVQDQGFPQHVPQMHHEIRNPGTYQVYHEEPHQQNYHPVQEPKQQQFVGDQNQQIYQPVQHQVHQPVHQQMFHQNSHDINNQIHQTQPIHQQLDQPTYHHMEQPVHHHIEQQNQHRMDQPVHPQVHQEVQFQFKQTEPQHVQQNPSYHDIPHQEPTKPNQEEDINLEHIESYTIDPNPNPVSFIDKNKKVEPIIKSPLESDVPYSHKTKDEPLYRLVSKPEDNQIPQNEIMEESVVENVEIPSELPKNNGYPDDKPFQGEGPIEEHEHKYLENVKNNFEQQYRNMYVNPHIDGHRLVNQEHMDQLTQINERNKKLHSEYISQQMKVGTEQRPQTQVEEEHPQPRKLSNIEGLTTKGEEHVKVRTGDQIKSEILDTRNQNEKEFVQADEPFHHNIGVTLNQINTFASKNTKILEGQNDSSIPMTDQSELMTPVKNEQPEVHQNVFDANNEEAPKQSPSFKKQNECTYYKVENTTPGDSYLVQNHTVEKTISHPESNTIQTQPGEIISFKKTTHSETQNINVQPSPHKIENKISTNTIKHKDYSPVQIPPVENSIKYQVQQPMKSSYINETKEVRYSNMEQSGHIITKQPKQTVDSTVSKTTASSRIIGKYEVMYNPQTKKRRIVIPSKPIKFSHRAAQHIKNTILTTSQNKVPYLSTKSETTSKPLVVQEPTQFRTVLNNHVESKPHTYTKSSNSITHSTNTRSVQSKPNSIMQSATKVTRISTNTGHKPHTSPVQPISTTSYLQRSSNSRINSSNNLPAKVDYTISHNEPKVIRVSTNNVTPTRTYQSGRQTNVIHSRTLDAKKTSYASPVSTYRTSEALSKLQSQGTKVISSGNTRPVYREVISDSTTNSKKIKISSNLLNSYATSNQVKALSSRTGAVNYVSKKTPTNTTKLSSIYRPTTNISKNSIRYEKLNTNSFSKGTTSITYFNQSTDRINKHPKDKHCEQQDLSKATEHQAIRIEKKHSDYRTQWSHG